MQVSVPLSLLSALLLVVSFPRFAWGYLAWIALVPLFGAMERSKNLKEILMNTGIAGLVFFGFSMFWLNHVAVAGWFLVAGCLSLYWVLFGLLSYAGRALPVWLKPFWIAMAWTSVEILRSEVPVLSAGWNLLAYSQAGYPVILQAANTVGAYGLGFGMVFVNACLAEILKPRPKQKWFSKSVWIHTAMVLIFLAALAAHGKFHLAQPLPERPMRLSVVQGNIPQSVKWEPMARGKILQIYLTLTRLAHLDRPELIVWPEAAFPGYLNQDLDAAEVLKLSDELQIPMVVGSPHLETPQIIYNSAYLLHPNAGIQRRYDKLFLVPFGEYVPLKPFLSWLEPLAYTMGVGDFSAGKEFVVFETVNGIPFSVLICFEDILPFFARKFMDEGAAFLVVITNDAWFQRSSAPYQHLQVSIFRAVENGVSIVRAANTGISGFISPKGEVLARVGERAGEDIFVAGRKTAVINTQPVPTLYRRGGYLFPYFVLGFLTIGLAGFALKRRLAQR